MYWIAALLYLLLAVTVFGCGVSPDYIPLWTEDDQDQVASVPTKPPRVYTKPFGRNVPVKGYFHFMDSLVKAYDSLTQYSLTEHLIIRANPRIIDTLSATDYYRMMEKGIYVRDQKSMVVLHKGDSIFIPDSTFADSLINRQLQTKIDINIPEFALRIIEQDSVIHFFPVRVGQNKKGYLAVVGNETNWRTRTGKGEVAAIYREPIFRNLQTGKAFEYTRRDDGKTTLMPLIPTLEPEINGVCSGQLIHATTNPRTLGKAYSHGCIGTREGDAWRIYYHAPLGTKIEIRYDLQVPGDTSMLEDVYGLQ